MNSPRHNASHQHHSTSAQATNKQQPTPRNQTQPQQQTLTSPPTLPQQQPSTTNNTCTVTRTATTPATATTSTPSNNSNHCSVKVRPRTHSLSHRCPRFCTEKVKGSSKKSRNNKQCHMASNSTEIPSQHQVTPGPQSQPSGPEQQNARASRPGA